MAYVFAGSIRHEMEALFRTPTSPFFKAVSVVEVGALDRRRFQAYLDRSFRAGERSVLAATYGEIFTLAPDNPSDVQQLCAALWDHTDAGET